MPTTQIQLEDAHNGTKSKSEWTIVKEIIGTFVGVSPFIVGLVIWGSSVNERIRVVEVQIQHIEAADKRHEIEQREQRQELLARLDRLAGQIEILQQLVAGQNGLRLHQK